MQNGRIYWTGLDNGSFICCFLQALLMHHKRDISFFKQAMQIIQSFRISGLEMKILTQLQPVM